MFHARQRAQRQTRHFSPAVPPPALLPAHCYPQKQYFSSDSPARFPEQNPAAYIAERQISHRTGHSVPVPSPQEYC